MIARHGGNNRTTGLWAYGYELVPPVALDRLRSMQDILDAGHAEARTRSQIWEGRFINGDDITHILVVAGTPAQDAEINRRLEAELTRLEAGYLLSVPVEVSHDPRWPSARSRFAPA